MDSASSLVSSDSIVLSSSAPGTTYMAHKTSETHRKDEMTQFVAERPRKEQYLSIWRAQAALGRISGEFLPLPIYNANQANFSAQHELFLRTRRQNARPSQ